MYTYLLHHKASSVHEHGYHEAVQEYVDDSGPSQRDGVASMLVCHPPFLDWPICRTSRAAVHVHAEVEHADLVQRPREHEERDRCRVRVVQGRVDPLDGHADGGQDRVDWLGYPVCNSRANDHSCCLDERQLTKMIAHLEYDEE